MPDKRRSHGSTLREVAELAGVSVASASKVLHGRGSTIRVSESRAATIRAAAQTLRYTPSELARQLRSNRTQSIGLVWNHMTRIADGPLYYVLLLDGVSAKLFEKHYRLVILSEVPEVDPVPTINDGRLDGVIWCKMPHDPAIFEELQFTNFKVVGLNSHPDENLPGIPFVSCDNEGGAELAVDHLVSLGHQRILFVVDKGWEQTPDAVARLNGFKNALAKHGLRFHDSDLVEWPDENPPLKTWWNLNPPHTAIFGWHEGIAAKILIAAQNAGISVPDELSVIGFDSTPFCESTKPRLTAVRQPVRQMAEVAAQILLDIIADPNVCQASQCFPCSIDVRDSTTIPRSRRSSVDQNTDVPHEKTH